MSLDPSHRDYHGPPLDERDAPADPFILCSRWFDEAKSVEGDPTAMALATATTTGGPSVRMVLLKGFDEHGFVFYTNYESRKAGELDATGRASLLFYWRGLD